MKKILVLDYPSDYYFPPIKYGGIERWLWSIAKQSINLGHKVVLSGPRWRFDTLPKAIAYPKRINKSNYRSFIGKFGKFDCIVGGHEYWNDDGKRELFEKISDKTFTFQLMPDLIYKKNVFDNRKHFLFCFSPEMKKRFAAQNPILSYCSGEGFQENPIKSDDKEYLVWIGRLDKDKAPHYAALAARMLKIPIYFIGKPIYQPEYIKEYDSFFKSKYVNFLGELAGQEKMRLISSASVAIYTCSRDWIEAAGMIFSEYSRSGIPIAALSWREGTAADIAINNKLGKVIKLEGTESDEGIADKLSKAIKISAKLNRDLVYNEGNRLYSPKNLTEGYFNTVFK